MFLQMQKTTLATMLMLKYLEVEGNSSSAKRELYGSLTWVAYPMLAPNQDVVVYRCNHPLARQQRIQKTL